MARALVQTGLPVVDVSAERGRTEFLRVSIDNEAVADLAFRHFQEKGFTRFGYCGDPRFLWSRERGKFFARRAKERKQSCVTFGLSGQKKWEPDSDGELKAIARWLSELPKPVGIFACYDGRAQQVIEACLHAGLSVPDEVAVLGVDNDEVLCDLCTPPLSSVQPNARRTGFKAAELLRGLMDGMKLPRRTEIIPPVGVIERQSTDIVAVPDPKIALALRFIREHACDGIGVKDVLRAVPMSRTLFDLKFKRLVGRSAHEHLLKAKIDHAKYLLATTELSIAAVGELSGFSAMAYFSTVFRRETKSTPYAFRQQHHLGSGESPL